MSDNNKREQLIAAAKKKAFQISRLLKTPDGEIFMDEIELAFGGSVCAESAHQTVIHAAYRDVLDWIKQVQIRGDTSE